MLYLAMFRYVHNENKHLFYGGGALPQLLAIVLPDHQLIFGMPISWLKGFFWVIVTC